MKQCKDCEYYEGVLCKKEVHDLPFLMVEEDNECFFERTKLRCKNCKHWFEITNDDRDFGGCGYHGDTLYPTFKGSPCLLKDKETRDKIEKESSKIIKQHTD